MYWVFQPLLWEFLIVAYVDGFHNPSSHLMRQVPLESDGNIAVNGLFLVCSLHQERAIYSNVLSGSRGTCLVSYVGVYFGIGALFLKVKNCTSWFFILYGKLWNVFHLPLCQLLSPLQLLVSRFWAHNVLILKNKNCPSKPWNQSLIFPPRVQNNGIEKMSYFWKSPENQFLLYPVNGHNMPKGQEIM